MFLMDDTGIINGHADINQYADEYIPEMRIEHDGK
jgi:hypothetical protein